MMVAGVDPSLTGTGVATADGLLHTVTSKPCEATIRGELARVRAIVNEVATLVYFADMVVIEAPSLGQSRQGGEHLRAGLWWLLVSRLDGSRPNRPIIRVPPATLKKFATGKGNATKADMRMALFQRAGIDERDDNRVDSHFLRHIGLHLVGHHDAVPLPKVNLSALDKLDLSEGLRRWVADAELARSRAAHPETTKETA